MGFCATCGQQIPANGVCPCTAGAAPQPAAPPQYGPPPAYGQYPQAPPSNLFNLDALITRTKMKAIYLIGSLLIVLRAIFSFVDYIIFMASDFSFVAGGSVWYGIRGLIVLLATTGLFLLLFRMLCDWLTAWYNKNK